MSYNPKTYWDTRKDPNSYETNHNQIILSEERSFLKSETIGVNEICVIGPGDGRILDSYIDKKITFVDITENYKEKLLNKFLSGGQELSDFTFFKVENINNLSFFTDNQFEALICSHVLLHVRKEDIESTIKELSRVSKKIIGIAPFSPYKTSANHVFVHDYEKICENLNLSIEKKFIKDSGQTRFVITK